jgi:hypothetical protein
VDEQQQNQSGQQVVAGHQVQQVAAAPQANVAGVPQVTASTKKNFPVLWLVAWLVAWPLGFAIALFGRFVVGVDASELIKTLVNISSALLGIYGLVGWIPFVIVLVLRSKK